MRPESTKEYPKGLLLGMGMIILVKGNQGSDKYQDLIGKTHKSVAKNTNIATCNQGNNMIRHYSLNTCQEKKDLHRNQVEPKE
jgi:hypothetical protein